MSTSFRTINGSTFLEKSSQGAGAFTVPVIAGMPRAHAEAGSRQSGNYCPPCSQNKGNVSGNWLGKEFDFTIGQYDDCCQTFSLKGSDTKVEVPLSIDAGKVYIYLQDK